MKRAIFFDVDGTILDSINGKSEMTPAVEEAIRKLQAAGDYVFVATGRPYAFISPYLHQFGFDGFLLSNGAQVIINDKTVYKKPMDRKTVKEITEAFNKEGIDYILEGDYYCYIRDEEKQLKPFFETVGIDSNLLVTDYHVENIDVFKIEVRSKNAEMSQKCLEIMSHYPEYEYFFSISGVLFEIHAKESTKATGIIKALELLNIPVENSFAFGDGTNDMDMLAAAGYGIAMGNASDKVKACADAVTAAVGKDGVAQGIMKYILKEEDQDIEDAV